MAAEHTASRSDDLKPSPGPIMAGLLRLRVQFCVSAGRCAGFFLLHTVEQSMRLRRGDDVMERQYFRTIGNKKKPEWR